MADILVSLCAERVYAVILRERVNGEEPSDLAVLDRRTLAEIERIPFAAERDVHSFAFDGQGDLYTVSPGTDEVVRIRAANGFAASEVVWRPDLCVGGC